MTGVTSVFQSSREAARYAASQLHVTDAVECLPERIACKLRPWTGAEAPRKCPQPKMPDARATLRLQEATPSDAQRPTGAPAGTTPAAVQEDIDKQDLRWALLLPMTSRGSESPEALWCMLKQTTDKLRASLTASDARRTTVYVCFDKGDILLDREDGQAQLAEVMHGLTLKTERLPPAYSNNICWIWDKMGRTAIKDGADLFVLLGDDVHLEKPGWQAAVEAGFAAVARERGLPFGCACIAMRDESFTAFPTFPVIHKLHYEIFGSLFPPCIQNQHGDPFLFEVYRRWGAARFAGADACLRNCLGGRGFARYNKKVDVAWHDEVLTRAVTELESWLAKSYPTATQVPCIDVVVPTYRCDVEALRALVSLPCDRAASVNTLVVVDRPDTANLSSILALQSYNPDRVVRVVVFERNMGASMARNTGLSQSFGDHAVLLDDDVVPDAGLLDAYLGAIDRYPSAIGYVGSTRLPAPATLVQHAIRACGICFFYDIAEKMSKPPWGVTANLCVKSRTQSKVWMSDIFPKTGGGEDVDFCVRLRRSSGEDLVSVPMASVCHPFWKQPFKQVSGWASGDVLCLDTLPGSAFKAPPNWIEVMLLTVLLALWSRQGKWATYGALAIPLEVAMLCAIHRRALPKSLPAAQAMCVLLASAIPPMLQDAVRLGSKLRRLRLSQLCSHFDWMDKKQPHVPATQLALCMKLLFWIVLVTAIEHPVARYPLGIVLAIASAAWVGAGGRVLPFHVAPRSRTLPLNGESTPFVVLATQRTGSNMLCGLLHGVPAISMHNELFNENGVFSHCGFGEHYTVHTRDADPQRCLLDALNMDTTAAAVGFKLFPEHIRRTPTHTALFESVLADPRVRKIVMQRENHLATAVSKLRASTTGLYTNKKLDSVRVSIPPDGLQQFCDSYNAYYGYLEHKTAGQNVLHLRYEDLTAAPLDTIGRVCQFLGVQQPAELPSSLFKPQTSKDFRSCVHNWDELWAAFKYTDRAKDFMAGQRSDATARSSLMQTMCSAPASGVQVAQRSMPRAPVCAAVPVKRPTTFKTMLKTILKTVLQ